jgi:outer membrane lipopolysaccharide assembly protein LptE/RlpB
MRQFLVPVGMLGALLLTGCAHYQLGDASKLPYTSLSIAPIVNQSYAPQVQTYLSEALFTELVNHGRVALLPNGKAETSLKVVLTDYRKRIGATSREDTGRARSLDLTLEAYATLVDKEGNVLYAQTFSATDSYYADNGSVAAESQAMPLLAHRLAEKIAKAVLGVW